MVSCAPCPPSCPGHELLVTAVTDRATPTPLVTHTPVSRWTRTSPHPGLCPYGRPTGTEFAPTSREGQKEKEQLLLKCEHSVFALLLLLD